MLRFKKWTSFDHLFGFLAIAMGGVCVVFLSVLVIFFSEKEQSLLTGPLVFCSVFFSIACCTSVARVRPLGKIDWFHPSVLYLMVYLAFFVFPGVMLWLVNDYQPVWIEPTSQPIYLVNMAFVLGVISIAFFCLGSHFNFIFPGGSPYRIRYGGRSIRFHEARYVVIVFLIIGFLAKAYHFSLLGPFSLDLFNYLSPSARREMGLHVSNFIILLESMLNWAVLIAVFFYLLRYKKTYQKRPYYLFVLVVFFVVVFVVDYTLSAKRSDLLPLILLPIVWYNYLIKRISLFRVVMLGTFVSIMFSCLLVVRIVFPLISQGLNPSYYIGDSFFDIVSFYFNTMEWSYFEMFLASISQRDVILSGAGGTIAGFFYYNFSTLVIFIPRLIWPSKPGYEDISQVYYRVVWGGDASVGASPTLWGVSYLFFGVVGLTVGMFFLGWLFKAIYIYFRPFKHEPFGVFFYAIFFLMAFQFLRFGTTGFTLIYFVQSIIVGAFVGLILLHKSRTHESF